MRGISAAAVVMVVSGMVVAPTGAAAQLGLPTNTDLVARAGGAQGVLVASDPVDVTESEGWERVDGEVDWQEALDLRGVLTNRGEGRALVVLFSTSAEAAPNPETLDAIYDEGEVRVIGADGTEVEFCSEWRGCEATPGTEVWAGAVIPPGDRVDLRERELRSPERIGRQLEAGPTFVVLFVLSEEGSAAVGVEGLGLVNADYFEMRPVRIEEFFPGEMYHPVSVEMESELEDVVIEGRLQGRFYRTRDFGRLVTTPPDEREAVELEGFFRLPFRAVNKEATQWREMP